MTAAVVTAAAAVEAWPELVEAATTVCTADAVIPAAWLGAAVTAAEVTADAWVGAAVMAATVTAAA